MLSALRSLFGTQICWIRLGLQMSTLGLITSARNSLLGIVEVRGDGEIQIIIDWDLIDKAQRPSYLRPLAGAILPVHATTRPRLSTSPTVCQLLSRQSSAFFSVHHIIFVIPCLICRINLLLLSGYPTVVKRLVQGLPMLCLLFHSLD